jgi:hypothetical protein
MSQVGLKRVKWAQTQNLNDVQHITVQEMYREVRATTNFSQEIELKKE